MELTWRQVQPGDSKDVQAHVEKDYEIVNDLTLFHVEPSAQHHLLKPQKTEASGLYHLDAAREEKKTLEISVST